MRIEQIGFKDFPPFADGIIDFPENINDELAEVHLITGQNGTGKTRLLSALAAALGNSSDLDQRHSAQPDHNIIVSMSVYNQTVMFSRSPGQIVVVNKNDRDDLMAGMMAGAKSPRRMRVQQGDKVRQINPLKVFKHLFEMRGPSMPFTAQAYRGSGRATDHKIAAMQPLKVVDPRANVSFDRATDDDSTICQAMSNLKMGAAMESQTGLPVRECRSIQITQRFEAAIATVTGRPFGFQVRPQPEVHLVVRWGSSQMKLRELPDGLRSIIAWLIACIAKLDAQYPEHRDLLDIPLILLLDEPESHLHPAWQRQLIPAAQKLFPNAQIFVASHSPFVISSVNSGWIHVLRTDESGLVNADEPKPCSKGDSWIDAVEDVLGVTEWYDPETEALLTEFRALKRKTLSERGDLNSLKEKAEAIASRSESLRSMMAREMHQLQRNMAEAVAEP